MGKIKAYNPLAKLIIGFIYQDEAVFVQAKNKLARKFGKIDFESGELAFNFTDYYKAEMGQGLKKRFISFKKLIPIQNLWRIKLYTNLLERKFSFGSGRLINIDPGYLDSAKLILATTKDYAHRIFLAQGIFAEVTLTYRGNSYSANDWTYRDYRTQEYLDIFNQIRKLYLS